MDSLPRIYFFSYDKVDLYSPLTYYRFTRATVFSVAACNRTYFGDVGRTYELEIRRPREDRLPFLCHLNFTAAGRDLGDLVQVRDNLTSLTIQLGTVDLLSTAH